MARPPPLPPSRDEAIDHLEHAAKRVVLAANRAMALQEARDAINDLGRRPAISQSTAAAAAGLYDRATITEQIAIVVRLFDKPGRVRGQTDRLTFPVARELLAMPGVVDRFVQDAREWPDGEADLNEEIIRFEVGDFASRLDRLATENPNREAILRRFRDVNIGHELRDLTGGLRPQYDQLRSLTEEVLILAARLAHIVEGAVIAWPTGAVGRSATDLWNWIADGATGDADGDLQD